MTLALAALLLSTADAQTLVATVSADAGTTTDLTTPSRVDPAYLVYLDALDDLWDLNVATHPQPQLWDGMVNLTDLRGNPLGTIFVGGNLPLKQESWYMPEAIDLHDSFRFQHQGVYGQGTEPQILTDLDADWQMNPCFDQWVKYTELPNAALTAHLDYEPGITRTHFEMWQDGDMVGHLLREHHEVEDMPERIVDHWAFFDQYVFPDKADAEVSVLVADEQFETSTAFFQAMDQEADWLAFAQVQYRPRLGLHCITQLSF
jgi:hypothetical protein